MRFVLSLCGVMLVPVVHADEIKPMVNSVGMTFQPVPAGAFLMGSPKSEQRPAFPGSGGSEDEGPRHKVKISKPFLMATTEVSQQQWTRVMQTSVQSISGLENFPRQEAGPKLPMIYVTWYDAVSFCNALSRSEKLPPFYKMNDVKRRPGSPSIVSATVTILGGKGYRLPTEAEWEYACRAGTTTPYAFGKRLRPGDARTEKSHARVGTHRKNVWGLYDMHGNVYEWCQDWYGGKYYATSPKVDPPGPKEGRRRVIRGGSYQGLLDWCRSANRTGNRPGSRTAFIGFRVAQSPEAKQRNPDHVANPKD